MVQVQAKPELISTVAGTLSNTYVSLKFAHKTLGDTLEGAEWYDFEESDQARALVSATNAIDQELVSMGAWYGKYDNVDPEQALMFPRSDSYSDLGVLEIPLEVQQATAYLANAMLEKKHGDDPIDADAMHEKGLGSVFVPGSVSFVAGAGKRPRSTWPRNVQRLMSGFMEPGGRTHAGRRRGGFKRSVTEGRIGT